MCKHEIKNFINFAGHVPWGQIEVITFLSCLQVEPIYETTVPIKLYKFSWSNVYIIQNKHYNDGYMYEEIQK